MTTEPLEVGTYEFRLRQVDSDGSTSTSETVEVEMALDEAYRLSPVSPNPVRTQAQMSVTVREPQEVTVSMYNVLGQRVATLHRRSLSANQPHDLPISVRHRPSGPYFLRIEGETFTDTRRMMVVR